MEMTYSREDLKEMIPLYVNGRLSESEMVSFSKNLEKHPELKAEVMEFSELREVYGDIEKEIPMPSDTLFARIEERIHADEDDDTVEAGTGFIERLRLIMADLFRSPRVAWAVGGVQLTIILILILSPSQEAHRFRTLTSKPPVSVEGVRLHVVFQKDAREGEIREALNAVGATIINGPSPEGLYTIEVTGGREEQTILDSLKRSKAVRFSEMAY
jgi:anti-sigma factor RsiW